VVDCSSKLLELRLDDTQQQQQQLKMLAATLTDAVQTAATDNIRQAAA